VNQSKCPDDDTAPLLVLLGDPVAHSVSPVMHNAALRALGLPGRYEPQQVNRADLAGAVERLRRPPYLGANVTIPHKEAVAALVDETTEVAQSIGAVNTLIRDGDRLRGHNTDAQGLLGALEHCLGMVPYNMRVLLLGAGGAARAAAVALLSGGVAGLAIYNRSPERARQLAQVLLDGFGGRIGAVDVDGALDEAAEADLIVNATSAGMDGNSLPLAKLRTRPGAALYDMVYTPSPTPLMAELASQGAHVADGLEMLVRQAAASFAEWTRHEAPIDVMRVAAVAELARRGKR
jgi:shikimate dehydrogenase